MRPDVYILTGPIQSGKTTTLLNWVTNKNVGGILSPILEGKRVVYLIRNKCYLPFEVSPMKGETITVGRYTFSKAAFNTINDQLLRDAQGDFNWLIVDEVGPLELQNEGFHFALQEIIGACTKKILLVVRDGLVKKVIEKFQLEEVQIISKDKLPTIQ